MDSAGDPCEAIVVGGGPAGLAAAAMLKQVGVEAMVLDRAEAVGASWRRRYDRLRLNTARCLSGLPGLALERRYGPWVSRDDFVAYLERYARHHNLTIHHGVKAQRVEAAGHAWQVQTSRGTFTAPSVVIATGYDHTPTLPPWPGRESFTGELVHSIDYRNPVPWRGRDVLVVGTGSTANELAVDLLEGAAQRVRVSMRTPPNTFPRAWLGVPTSVIAHLGKYLPAPLSDQVGFVMQRLIWGDLSRHGLPRAPEGIATTIARRRHGITVDGGLIDAVKRGQIEIVAAVERLDGPQVILADDNRLTPDAVIAATGYRQALEPLVGHLGVLDPDGRPTIVGAQTTPQAPGLHFIGYRLPISGQLPQISTDARAIARAIARQRARSTNKAPGTLGQLQESVRAT